MDNRVSLFKKILSVQKVLEPLEKSGRNDFHKYSYTTAGDVLLPVSRACNAHGLIIVADVVESRIEAGKAWVTVKLTIADVDTGESITASAPGYAEDKGDKHLYKAITGAIKYAVRSFFCLPSEDDPERPERQANTPSATNGKPTRPATVNSLQPVQGEPAPKQPVTSNGVSTTTLEQTSVEMERIGWTAIEGRQFLEQTFGKRGRKELTASELHQFLGHLRSLPSMSARAPAAMAS